MARTLKKSRSSCHASLLPPALAALFVASLATCHGGVLQFDANHLSTTVVTNSIGQIKTNLVWESFQGITLAADASDWEKTTNASGNSVLINTKGATASPFLFATNAPPNAHVQYMVIALRTGQTIRFRETFACGRVVARISGAPENEPVNPGCAVLERGAYCEIAYHMVNNQMNAPLETSKAQIVEIHFGEPLFLNELAILQDMGRVTWGRGFGGPDVEIYEMLCFPITPSAGVLKSVHRHLDKRWGMQIGAPSPSTAQIIEAKAENVRFFNRFSTLLIIK